MVWIVKSRVNCQRCQCQFEGEIKGEVKGENKGCPEVKGEVKADVKGVRSRVVK